jgi:ATP phosphoribosyltransferase regulatory subunit
LPVADVAALKARLDAKDTANVPDAYRPLIAAAGPFVGAVARLRAFDTAGLFAARLDALEAIVAALPGDINITLDPTELHGFEFQSWLGFSVFSADTSGEIARGGAYRVGDEPAIGFSAYIDPLIDAGLAQSERRRLFLPQGTNAAKAAALRAQGWVTVAALGDGDTAEAQICTHILREGQPVQL